MANLANLIFLEAVWQKYHAHHDCMSREHFVEIMERLHRRRFQESA